VCYAIGSPADADSDTDAPGDTAEIALDAPADAPAYVPWATPVELNSLETTAAGETDPSVTANKLTVVFVADVAPNDAEIFIATRAALTDTFSFSLLTAVNAAGFNDKSPEISADGSTIYFRSNRTGSNKIYMSTFSTVWSAPAIVPALSTAGEDGDLAISPDGLTSIVIDDTNSHHMLFRTRANTSTAFGMPAQHTELHISTDIAGPSLTNNGETVYFHAGGTRQLYVAHLMSNGTYTTPTKVTELNVAGVRCASPFVTQTDDYMIFDRAGDIFESTR
jgi:Tol biopolymer transport system component